MSFLPVITYGVVVSSANSSKDQWLQVPKSDMERLGRLDEGIELPGGGYFATLAVFHDLHCLVRIISSRVHHSWSK